MEGLCVWPRGFSPQRFIPIREYRCNIARSREKISTLLTNPAYSSISIKHEEGEIALYTNGLTFHYSKHADFFSMSGVPIIQMKTMDKHLAITSKIIGEDKILKVKSIAFTSIPCQCVVDVFNKCIDKAKHEKWLADMNNYFQQEDKRRRDVNMGIPSACDAERSMKCTVQFRSRIQELRNLKDNKLDNAQQLLDKWKPPKVPKARMRKRKQCDDDSAMEEPSQKRVKGGSPIKRAAVTKPPVVVNPPEADEATVSSDLAHHSMFKPCIDQMTRILDSTKKAFTFFDSERIETLGTEFKLITNLLSSIVKRHVNQRTVSLDSD